MDASGQGQGIEVATDAVLVETSGQRNAAHDQVARLTVLVKQLMAERDEARAEVERLRGGPEPGA